MVGAARALYVGQRRWTAASDAGIAALARAEELAQARAASDGTMRTT